MIRRIAQRLPSAVILLGFVLAGEDSAAQGDRVHFAVQGFSMRIRMMNVGAFGKVSCPPFSGGGSICAAESLGLEYPVGQQIEHIYGGGIWIGGLLDTSRSGTQTPLRLVSLTYEGAGHGSNHEFYPGPSAADSFWRASRFDSAAPPGWEEYWGTSLPFRPISDADYHCAYTDNDVRLPGHVPLGLKVIQSSYAWNDPYADAILIFSYRIVNIGRRRIDSAYVGYSVDADVGPATVPAYYTRNSTGYISESRTAYVQNSIDEGSTPIGFTLLSTTKPLDSLRYTFQWFPLFSTPANDRSKYDMMSSGVIRPDEFPAMSDTRFLFSFGPFTLLPSVPGREPDTLTIAVAIVSGFSRRIDHRLIMQRNAARALDIYLNQGIRLPATPPSPPLRVTAGFRRVEVDWRWRPGDEQLFGRPDPELNWDSTNQVARRYPYRYRRPPEPPAGIDTARGGRNFEAYRLWRSEDPRAPEQSFTLLQQYDDPRDSFEFNTGLRYTFVDSNLVRGKVYTYAVTSKAIPNLAYQEIVVGDTVIRAEVPVDPLESGKLTNAVRIELPFSVSTELGRVSVVPNPYRTDRSYVTESGGYEGPMGDWDESRRKIRFINLPEVCTIRVFSLSGDLVKTIEHDGRNASGYPRGDHDMVLVSESNRALASGIYIFVVESALGHQTGKFAVIR